MVERASVVVTLQHPEVLGIDEWRGSRYAVVPALLVRACVREPRIKDDQWDASFRRQRWADTLETFKGWGHAMVEVQSFGIVVGEFLVRPYLITAEQFSALLYQGVV